MNAKSWKRMVGLSVAGLLALGAGAAWAAEAGEAGEGEKAAAVSAAEARAADEAAIRQAALDYAGSWYHGDRDLLEGALHPELCKRRILPENKWGRQEVHHQGALKLMQGVAQGWGKKTPEAERQADVTILDLYGTMASVRLEMKGWIDYMHLGKVDGRWVIINVLWESKPRPEGAS